MKYKVLLSACFLGLVALFFGAAATQATPEKIQMVVNKTEPLSTKAFEERFRIAQVTAAPTSSAVSINPPSGSGSTEIKTTIHGGSLASSIIEWFTVAFGGLLSVMGAAIAYKILEFFGVKVTDQQKQQLQAIIVNGINASSARFQDILKNNAKLDIEVRNQIIADAVEYAQKHGGATIKALGLDPNSGEAVEAIRARIETALADPATPTTIGNTPDVVAKVNMNGPVT